MQDTSSAAEGIHGKTYTCRAGGPNQSARKRFLTAGPAGAPSQHLTRRETRLWFQRNLGATLPQGIQVKACPTGLQPPSSLGTEAAPALPSCHTGTVACRWVRSSQTPAVHTRACMHKCRQAQEDLAPNPNMLKYPETTLANNHSLRHLHKEDTQVTQSTVLKHRK